MPWRPSGPRSPCLRRSRDCIAVTSRPYGAHCEVCRPRQRRRHSPATASATASSCCFAHSPWPGRRVAIPCDVYPVYWRIAAAAGVATSELDTFPDFDLPKLLAQATSDGTSVVLLQAPLKLHGRAWTAAEADVAARCAR